jgi:hypothetical protein
MSEPPVLKSTAAPARTNAPTTRAPEARSVSPEPSAARQSSTAEPVSAETSEVDVRTLFEQSSSKEAKQGAEPAPPRGARAAEAKPLDLAGSEGIDAEILDDDAFFATLRDAKDDETPLGPRDDDDPSGENQFFDQDAERGTFRDVFRRRR